MARYVRLSLLVEAGEANAAIVAETRRLAGDLGLSPVGLARLCWRVADAAAPAPVAVLDRERYRRVLDAG